MRRVLVLPPAPSSVAELAGSWDGACPVVSSGRSPRPACERAPWPPARGSGAPSATPRVECATRRLVDCPPASAWRALACGQSVGRPAVTVRTRHDGAPRARGAGLLVCLPGCPPARTHRLWDRPGGARLSPVPRASLESSSCGGCCGPAYRRFPVLPPPLARGGRGAGRCVFLRLVAARGEGVRPCRGEGW